MIHLLLVSVLGGCRATGADALFEASEAIRLADDGRPSVKIHVSPEILAVPDPRFHGNLSRYAGQNHPWGWTEAERIAAAALDLRDLLNRIVCRSPDCGFSVEAWTPETRGGIWIGRPSDFGMDSPFTSTGVLDREQYLLRTGRERRVLALGAEAAGVEDAVWELARQLGYRYYLPTPTWEILPEARGGDLDLPEVDLLARPMYVNRRLAGAPTRAEGHDLQAWSTRNGFAGSFQAKGVEGQYGPIYDSAADWFRKNPGAVSESSRPKEGQRSVKVKFGPGYVDKDGVSVLDVIARAWALPHLAITDPDGFDNGITRDALPLHHGDSALWAGCAPGTRGGPTPADRAVTLANGVIERVGDRLGDRLVSVMGYREPFAGPLRTRVDPRLYVWLYGNGYLGTPFEEALETWKKAGARHFGWYAYWTAPAFQVPDDGAPYLAPSVVARQLVELSQQGFSSLWLESNGGWMPGGLWKWLLIDIARAPAVPLDQVGQAVARRKQDLLEHAFSPEARPHVERALERLDLSEHRLLLSPDRISELYRELGAARKASEGPSRARVEDLLVYVRYLDLYLKWKDGGSYDPLIDHAFCTDDRRMTDARLLWDGTPPETQAGYRQAHEGRTPAEVRREEGCPAPDFDGWIRDRPEPTLGRIQWWSGTEGRYARATRFPGTAKGGSFEGDLHGNPRDSRLWRVWIDPAEGLTVTQACHGVQDRGDRQPAVNHLTSRLLGRSAIELRAPGSGALACRAVLAPDRAARDITFARGGARVEQSRPPIGSGCRPAPRDLTLDTGAPEIGVEASCDPKVFSEAGIYELDTLNHRTGLDYDALTGKIGVSRWESPFLPQPERTPETGNQYRYFYVPKGLETVAFWTSGMPCRLVRDRVRAHDVDLGAGGPGYRLVSTAIDGVRHDGEIWELSACREVYLVNLPPVVAPKRELLLVPCSFATDPARAADVENLGVDLADCR